MRERIDESPAVRPRSLLLVVHVTGVGIACTLALALMAWIALGLGVWAMPGVRVAGRRLPAQHAVLPALRQSARSWQEQSLTIEVGHHVFQPQRAYLGFSL